MPSNEIVATQNLAVHPGRKLHDEYMTSQGISANALAMALRVPVTRISEIVRGRRGVSADTALRLARYFQTTPQFWLELQLDYDLASAMDGEEAASLLEIHPRHLKTSPTTSLTPQQLPATAKSRKTAKMEANPIPAEESAELAAQEPDESSQTTDSQGGWRSRFAFAYGGPLPGCNQD